MRRLPPLRRACLLAALLAAIPSVAAAQDIKVFRAEALDHPTAADASVDGTYELTSLAGRRLPVSTPSSYGVLESAVLKIRGERYELVYHYDRAADLRIEGYIVADPARGLLEFRPTTPGIIGASGTYAPGRIAHTIDGAYGFPDAEFIWTRRGAAGTATASRPATEKRSTRAEPSSRAQPSSTASRATEKQPVRASAPATGARSGATSGARSGASTSTRSGASTSTRSGATTSTRSGASSTGSSAPATRPSGATAAAGTTGSRASAILGTWWGVQSMTQIEVKADGTYSSPNGGQGRWRMDGEDIYFTGALAGWNHGHAKLTGGGWIEFLWTDASGASYLFQLIRR